MAVYWIPNVLLAVGAPFSADNRDFLNAWWAWEGGNGGPNKNIYPSAKYNWLNSMTPVLGSSNFNSVGVQNYPTYLQGIYATVKTLKDPKYYNLLHALKAGNPMSTSWRKGVSAGLSTWVSGKPDSEEGLAYAKRVIDLALVYRKKRLASG